MTFVSLNESTQDPVVVTLDNTQPSLFDTITYNNETVDFSSGGTVVFFMRPLLSRTPIIDSVTAVPITPPNADGNNVRYDWQASDVTIEGPYMGWWGYEFPGSQLAETPEFRIVITDHGPGFGAATGVVTDGVSMWMPTTVAALRKDPNFGDRMLQKHADAIKQLVMGIVVAPDQEANYDPMLVEYLSKRTAIRLITPAKDYWARQYRQVLTNGPSESATYPDMLKNLDDLHARLSHEAALDWRQLQRIVPGLPQLRIEPMPMSSLGDQTDPNNQYVTPDPQLTQRPRLGGPRFNPWFQF